MTSRPRQQLSPVTEPASPTRKRTRTSIRAHVVADPPNSSESLPLAVWTDLPTFAGAIEHWLRQDAFNKYQIAYLLDPRAAVAMRAQLAMLWAFSDERHSNECDLEATRRAVCEFLQSKLRAIEEDAPRRAAALRKAFEEVRRHG